MKRKMTQDEVPETLEEITECPHCGSNQIITEDFEEEPMVYCTYCGRMAFDDEEKEIKNG